MSDGPLCWVAAVAALSIGCSYGATAARIDEVGRLVAVANEAGARRCAPRAFATATAQLGFARDEFEQGDVRRAEEHLVLAEPNARAALLLSPYESCGPGSTRDSRDADGDGVLDVRDRCPSEPGLPSLEGCPRVSPGAQSEDPRRAVAEDGDGDGVPDDRDLCLIEAEDIDGYLDDDGCPDADDDVDGLPDRRDPCPRAPEDLDGFQDDDGCPEPDNDEDGVLDESDRCPNEAGVEALLGCPREYPDVSVTPTRVRLARRVTFEGSGAVLTDDARRLLDTVALLLGDQPLIRLDIQGHTDSDGTDESNARLSQQRADAVRRHLVSRGVDAERLTAHGLGESVPIASNSTAAGQAENRRIELVRTDVTEQTEQQ